MIIPKTARTIRMGISGRSIGHVHEFHLDGLRSSLGKPLLHRVAYYTINRIPE